MEDDYVEQTGLLSVQDISQWSVQVVARVPRNIQAVVSMGGVADSTRAGTWRIDYGTEDQLASLLQSLRDAGLAFAGGPGWPPSAVAEMLRDKGKFHGVIREAIWFGPNQQMVQNR